MEGAGGSPGLNAHNLIPHNILNRNHRGTGERPEGLANELPAEPKAARIWSERYVLAGLLLLVATPIAVAGCGHATVPCPTPTSELDRLRDDTERVRTETDRAEAEGAALEDRRDAAALRAAVAQAALDSLGAGEGR